VKLSENAFSFWKWEGAKELEGGKEEGDRRRRKRRSCDTYIHTRCIHTYIERGRVGEGGREGGMEGGEGRMDEERGRLVNCMKKKVSIPS